MGPLATCHATSKRRGLAGNVYQILVGGELVDGRVVTFSGTTLSCVSELRPEYAEYNIQFSPGETISERRHHYRQAVFSIEKSSISHCSSQVSRPVHSNVTSHSTSRFFLICCSALLMEGIENLHVHLHTVHTFIHALQL